MQEIEQSIGAPSGPCYTAAVIVSFLKTTSVGCLLTAATLAGPSGEAAGLENTVFVQFTNHVVRQVHRDKQAFTQASTCLSWFYKRSKSHPPPAVQGIRWHRTAAPDQETDCLHLYPGGMDAARDDFAKTQALLAVSLTVYEFALVADRNDDHAYNPSELQDLFASLSLPLDTDGGARSPVAMLTERFDQWYRGRDLDEVMKGMSALYERGYRVTAGDRAELDRVMK